MFALRLDSIVGGGGTFTIPIENIRYVMMKLRFAETEGDLTI